MRPRQLARAASIAVVVAACSEPAPPAASRPAPSAPTLVGLVDAAVAVDAIVVDALVVDAAIAKIPCDTIVDRVVATLPPLGPKVAERDWVAAARRRLVLRACDRDWDAAARQCTSAAADAAAIAACFADGYIGFTDDEPRYIEENARKIAALKRKPHAIDCKRVDIALTPYGECDGPLKRPDMPGKRVGMDERIRESEECVREAHASRLKRCRVQRWPVSLRACFVALGPMPDIGCMDELDLRYGEQAFWDLEPLRVADTPIECAAYAGIVKELESCEPVPPTADASRRDLAAAIEQWKRTPAAARPTLAKACQQGVDTVRAAAAAAACEL